jgi:hypothetical protein
VPCGALRTRSEKTRGDPTDIRYDEVSRWKDLDRDFCASRPDVVQHWARIQTFRLDEDL